MVGDSGVILKTSDSGKNWIKINTGLTNNLRDISFFQLYPDYFEIVVVGDSVIAITKDLGNTWSIEKMPYMFFSCIYTPPFDQNIIVGDLSGRLFIKPRGFPWRDTLLLPGEPITALGFDYNTPKLTGENVTGASTYHTFRTLFPNDKWTITENPLEYHDFVWGGDLSNFPQYLVGVTGNHSVEGVYWKNELSDTMWVTEFDSIKWKRYPNKILWTYLRSVDAIGDFVAMCGALGLIMRSMNQGTEWITDHTLMGITLNSIKFYTPDKGFCVGENGTILYYSKNITSTQEEVKPTRYQLHQNYPNPFNPVTKIQYEIVEPGLVSMKVFDLLGAELAILVNEIKEKGVHKVDFDAGNLRSGVYFYQLKTKNFIETKKMTLIK